MRFANHVSVLWDITGYFDWIPALPACHNHLYIAPPPALLVPVPFGVSIELPSIIGHPPGALLGDHKLTSTVYHNHVWFALDGHDLGHVLMHICVPPVMPGPCTMNTLNIALSSRKAKFTAGEVKANGKAVACCTMIEPSSPGAITPMMICGAVPSPLAGCGMSVALNSLVVGMDWTDLIAGWVDIIVTMIQATITNALSAGTLERGELEAVGFDPVPDFGGLAGAGVRHLGQQYGHRGDASYEYKPIGGPFLDGGIAITSDGESGDTDIDLGGGVHAGGIAGAQGGYHESRHPDGHHDSETTGGVGWWGGGDRTVTGHEHDGRRRPTTTDGHNTSLPWSDDVDVPFL